MSEYRNLRGKKIKTFATDLANEQAEGQIFFSTASQFQGLKTVVSTSAWSAGANLNTNRRNMGSGQTPATAGVVFGGFNGTAATAVTEEYDGTGFSNSGNMGTARYQFNGFGVQTAAVGAGGYVSGDVANVEEYNGSTWAEVTNIPGARRGQAGFGTLTAGVICGGVPNSNATLHYDGTNWTAGGNLPAGTDRTNSAGTGTQTAGLVAAGDTHQAFEYDGSSWTNGGSTTSDHDGGSDTGLQTAALVSAGFESGGSGRITACETYDGTSFSTSPATLTQGRYSSGRGGAVGTTAFLCGGDANPGLQGVTEEFNISVNTITGAAWASGGNMNTPRAENFGVSGTIPAAVAFGGYTPGSPNATANSEEYNGTSWTEGNNLGTARWDISGAGTQTAALVAGGGTPGSTANCEEYNGTSWAEQNNLNTQGRARTSGTQTAGMVSGRKDVPGITVNCETYDGTSWTEIANLNTARGAPQQVGDSSNALNASGTQDGAGGVVNVGNVESWDGSSWTEVANVLDDSRSGQGAGAYDNMMLLNGSDATNNNTQMWNGTAWFSGTSTPYNASGGGANGPSSAVIQSGGGDADATIEFTGETTALNVKTLTDS